MAIKSFALFFLFLFFVSRCFGECEDPQQQQQQQLNAARQCRLQQLSPSRPSQRVEAEGGMTEFWDEREDQLQCSGVSARKHIIRSRSMLVPLFENAPGILYIQQGNALVGISAPGCPESFHSSQRSPRPFEEGSSQQFQTDSHNKLYRVRQGDIMILPAGTTHWCYNDGDQDLIAIAVFDLNNQANQLESSLRTFLLAGNFREQSSSTGQQYEQEKDPQRSGPHDNIIRAFDQQMISEALNIPQDIVRQMQRSDKRGHMIRVEQGLSLVWPEEQEEQEECMDEARPKESQFANGLEEAICYARVQYNLDRSEDSDIYSRQAGRLKSVDLNKLSALRFIDMSVEKINLRPGAMFVPHWTMNAHTIMYVTRGEGQVQVVDNRGRNLFNGRVRQGELIVVPQYYVAMMKAGRSTGFEWVSFKTAGMPVRNPLVGQLSLFRGVPVQVIANSYRISIGQARQLKQCRQQHFMLFPPASSSASTAAAVASA
ncbi:hypothetical protein J5N97_024501 [Dioscorea zingiberensis]|uniref:Cupin type-1 domain-containing protein n=1 Tax=Dioscorea zingiberensis TaxID=325984 RepID=A0A9D5C755_9LILI|nr:hypothetical protein J5N97_024501 [Dioscorea zingiberensis]